MDPEKIESGLWRKGKLRMKKVDVRKIFTDEEKEVNDRRVKKLQEAYTNIKHNADGTRLISNFVTPLRKDKIKTSLKTKVIETSY